ncbi:MAG: hypothetical protein Q9167_007555, partial [Letrouitia subvulpina]
MNLRLSSPFLAASDWTTYLLGQYSDLQTYCTTSMALVTASTSLVLGTMPLPTATTTGTTTAASPSTTCAGQLVSPPSQPMSCNALSVQYGVTTGDLTVITNDWACQFSSPICLPLPCDTMKIGWGQTCESLRSSISTSGNNVTTAQFSTWNWRIVGKCDKVRGDQYICKGPPGGKYTAPPPIYAPTASSAYYSTGAYLKSVNMQSPRLPRALTVSAGLVMEMQSAPALHLGIAAPTTVTGRSMLNNLSIPLKSLVPQLLLSTFVNNNTYTPAMSNPQLCASLHDALIHRLPNLIQPPESPTIATLLQQNNPALFTALHGSNLMVFLSLVTDFSPDPDLAGGIPYLTPQVLKPDPARFLAYRDLDIENLYPAHILLYPDPESSSGGGIIYDPKTDLATWGFLTPWPRAEDWAPLEAILRQWLHLWETGKYIHDPDTGALAVRGWVARDVDDALEAWDALLDAIASHLPPSSSFSSLSSQLHEIRLSEDQPILSPELLDSATYHPFASAFLSRARAPPPHIPIAPGIITFTANTFTDLILSEPASSPRRQYLSRRFFSETETPVLLFPTLSLAQVPSRGGNVKEEFDQEWGFGKFTIDRRAGWYLYPQPEVGAEDVVVL